MDQTVNYETEVFLRNALAKSSLRVSELEGDLESVSKFKEDIIIQSNTLHRKHTNLQDSLKEWTRAELANDDITIEQAQALAEIGEFTITKSYDVTIVVEHSFTVELEASDDIDDVLGTLDFSVDSYHTTIDNVDYSIVETNYDETN
jgi:hypothetical protein